MKVKTKLMILVLAITPFLLIGFGAKNTNTSTSTINSDKTVSNNTVNTQKQNTEIDPTDMPVGILQVDPNTKVTYLEQLFDKAYCTYNGKNMTLHEIMATEGYYYNNIDDAHNIDKSKYIDNIIWSKLDNSKGYITRLRLVNYGPKMEIWLLPPSDDEKMYMGDDYKQLFMSKYIPEPSTSKYCMAVLNGDNKY